MPDEFELTPEATAVALAAVNLMGALMARLKVLGLLDQQDAEIILHAATAATAAGLDAREMSAAAPIALRLLQPIEGLLRQTPGPNP